MYHIYIYIYLSTYGERARERPRMSCWNARIRGAVTVSDIAVRKQFDVQKGSEAERQRDREREITIFVCIHSHVYICTYLYTYIYMYSSEPNTKWMQIS